MIRRLSVKNLHIQNHPLVALQEYNFDKVEWTPALGDPGSEILIKNNLKTNIYLMYCGKDKTNYTTPKDADPGKVFSVSVNSTRYAVIANHRYRIMAYNCYNIGVKVALLQQHCK